MSESDMKENPCFTIFSYTCKRYLILELNNIIFWVAARFLVFS